MMNWENIKKMLNENAMESAENNEKLLGEIAKVKAEMAEVEGVIISLQDMIQQAYQHKAELEAQCAGLETQYAQKQSISDTMSKIFQSVKTQDTSVEGISKAEKVSQQMSSSLRKARYDYKKGAITYDEFAQQVKDVGGSIDDEMKQM